LLSGFRLRSKLNWSSRFWVRWQQIRMAEVTKRRCQLQRIYMCGRDDSDDFTSKTKILQVTAIV